MATQRVGQPWLDRQERTSAPDQEARQPQLSGQTPFNR